MDRQEIVVVDVRIPFWATVWLMVRLALAAIPAFIILYVLAFLLLALPNYIR